MQLEAARKAWPVSALRREYLMHNGVCPLQRAADGTMKLAVTTEMPCETLDDLELAYGAAVVSTLVTPEELEALIERTLARAAQSIEFESGSQAADDQTADVRDLANQPPVIRYVNLLVRDAYQARASDIHLEAERNRLVARYRIDGVLVPALAPPAGLEAAVVSRIKLLAELDIAERRRPQDGRIRVRLEERELDLRVSCVPTMFGESVVLRLLDRGGRPVALEELGMPAAILGAVERVAKKPHGLFLVTGPTGSGKTTTLYAALAMRDGAAEKIVTVEDPVEYELQGIAQVPVHRSAGVTFATALRSVLRQDPDVIMIGELRDRETAEVAVQAAMTGHLVFSTLHTNDAAGAIPRLLDLGIPSFLIPATLEGVLAQRLVRRICDGCRQRYEPEPAALTAFAAAVPDAAVELTRGKGCTDCRGTGFRGRIGIFELVVTEPGLRRSIDSDGTSRDRDPRAALLGAASLLDDGWAKVLAGETTIEEVLRVVQG